MKEISKLGLALMHIYEEEITFEWDFLILLNVYYHKSIEWNMLQELHIFVVLELTLMPLIKTNKFYVLKIIFHLITIKKKIIGLKG